MGKSIFHGSDVEFSESWKKSDFRLTHLPKKSRRCIANSFWHTSLVWILWFDQVFHFCLKKYLPIKHFSLFVIFWASNQGSSSLELRRSVLFRFFYCGNAMHSKPVPAVPPTPYSANENLADLPSLPWKITKHTPNRNISLTATRNLSIPNRLQLPGTLWEGSMRLEIWGVSSPLPAKQDTHLK